MSLEPFDLISRLGTDLEWKTIANLGAGKCDGLISGKFRQLRCAHLINVEAYMPYYVELRLAAWATQNVENIFGSIQKWVLEQEDKSVDIVVLLDVLEHFPKEEALVLWQQFMRIARERIVVWLPFGPCAQDEYDGNPYQKHLSTWNPEDFEQPGYAVEHFPKFHLHINPPADAGWVTCYTQLVGSANENPVPVC
jgi:hypothetical protein